MILNSVVQYFPSAGYLLTVLERALALVERGAVFLGDIRSLPLLETYHASVEHHRAGDQVTRPELKARVRRALAHDNELVLHPLFFRELQRRFPQIAHVEVTPKRGAFRNELTLFRYDVTLYVGAPPAGEAPTRWRDVAAEGLGVADVRAWLSDAAPGQLLGLRNIPNARLRESDALRRWLARDDDAPWSPPSTKGAWDPEALFGLEAERACRVRVSWAEGRDDGSFDAVIAAGRETRPLLPTPSPAADVELGALANDPLLGERQRALVTALRRELRESLPAYALPSAIVVMPALPININGKVDRSALPRPELLRDPDIPLVEPETAHERVIAEIWCELLGHERVGIHDDFFELGGDSLLAVQAIARLPAAVGVELPVRALLERPTIHELAKRVELVRKTMALKTRRAESTSNRQRGRI